MQYNFTIIIPHWNIPDLLKRCLKSIPLSDDIEVIIIDDNSSNILKDNFPGITRKNTKVFFSEKSVTAGGARNIGLKHASGKWVLFADSDDFFNQGFINILTKYCNENYDVVYFGLNSRYSETLKICDRGNEVNKIILDAEKGDAESQNIIRYKFLYPYCKMIKRSFIEKFNIRFDEVIASNDTMFGVKIGVNSAKVAFDSFELYCLTLRENSLVTSYKYENLKSRLFVSFNLFRFLKQKKLSTYSQNSVGHLIQIRKVSYFKMFVNFFFLIKNIPFTTILKQFYDILKSKKNAK